MKRNNIIGFLPLRLVVVLSFVAPLHGLSNPNTSKLVWPEIRVETHPWTRWWWLGSAVDEKNLTASLDAYKKAGLGGVEITPVYGVRGEEDKFINYLSPKWMDMLEYTLREAKRLGIGVDMANASGWPFGGPWIDERHASKNFVTKTYRLKGGESLKEEISYIQQPLVRMQCNKQFDVKELKYPLSANGSLQENAFDQVRYKKKLPLISVVASKLSDVKGKKVVSRFINLTGKVHNKRLLWKAPAGEWLLTALFQGEHGKMVERASPGGEGWVIDHFSKEALDTYLDKFDSAFQGRDLSGLRYFFNDSYEVDDAIGEANWTPNLLKEFKRLNGYDLLQYLPALIGLDSLKASRVLYDYRMTINYLILNQYTKPWRQWAVSYGKGIRNQAHGSPANVLDLYGASDIPETEGGDIVNLKSASSAAHVTGKRLTSSETCTFLKEHFTTTLGDAKNAVDNMFLAGVNHIIYHGTAYSPQEATWPGWLFYASVHFTLANSWWEHFVALNQYVTRSQSFLQAGKPSNSILIYFSIADRWSQRVKDGLLSPFYADKFFNGLSMRSCADWFQAHGYSWDAISDKQLLDVMVTKSKLLVGGNTYSTVVVPLTKLMPVKTFGHLLSLAYNGATVLFQGGLPDDVPGLARLKKSRKEMTDMKKSLFKVIRNMKLRKGSVTVIPYGKGKIVISDKLDTLMSQTEIKPEGMVEQGLQCIRRKKSGGYYYFVKNSSNTAFEGWIPLSVAFKTAALYNPMTTVTGYAMIRERKEQRELWLSLNPGETIIIETFDDVKAGDSYPFYVTDGVPVQVNGRWRISFVKGGPGFPATRVLTTPLVSWTSMEGGVDFSGSAEYEVTLPPLVKTKKTEAFRLDLGMVYESAEVYLNGKSLGFLLNAPFTIDIPVTLFKCDGSDSLTIVVANLMANRIAALDRQGICWKKFYNTNFKAKLQENRDVDGLFTAKGWRPKPSGIVGTPMITSLRRIR